ncbi:hypothetical protein LB465_03240 [Salegentibacter sp. LM13S]|uniref:BfmA/BtgA family mobilization protein n=1 Tax=Salegentibacter lacus TaxID=2873599 RepID=UPI001CCEBD58|nr:BfmA/BtgA family mobilization protein [Salegentibacter lacus]MBZ9629782.1 hypothetical protein [Salegentibacter lacus]
MDKNYQKEAFEGLKIKASVARKFRKFCKSISRSQSASLDLMLNFFERNKLSPFQDLGPNMKSLEHVLKKRIDSSIAIVRDIETTQTKPTQAMLAALFENLPDNAKKKLPPSFEKALQNTLAHTPIILDVPEIRQEERDLKFLLDQIEQVKPAFGKPYLKIELPLSEIESLKQKYHVHHH